MDEVASIESALDAVGPRLKWLRGQRGMTLDDVSEATGISKSTMSRLETGQRRPSLELLLPLAQTSRVPLGELVGAPEVGDPRVGSADGRPTDVLRLFGRQGERAHVRTGEDESR